MNGLEAIKQTGRDARREYRKLGSGDGPGAAGHGGTSRTDLDGINAPAGAQGKYGKMFPCLTAHSAPSQALTALAAAMRDSEEAQSADSPIPAGYTYFGQFVDHDITLDTTTLSEAQIDPWSVWNYRTARFELDNVYGSGPEVSNFLYENGTGPKLLVGVTNTGRPLDLPRLPNGVAVIGDKRNDENLAVSQMQFAWIHFHNKVVDWISDRGAGASPGSVFAEARETTTWHYQWIVLHDLLSRLVRKEVLDDVLQNGRQFYKPQGDAFIPVEFSVAAYRMGHSMVRNSYDWNHNHKDATLKQLFQFSRLSGTLIHQADDWIADWRRMFDIDPPNGFTVNQARAIDPLLAKELHTLPRDNTSLPERNLQRGLKMGLPSGQDVARALHVEPDDRLAPEDFTGPDGAVARANGLDASTPLWYYILKEAQIKEGGNRLGAVGSRIVAEVFVGLLELDPLSFISLQPDWSPTLPSKVPGQFTMADMLRFSDNVNPFVNR